jgi:hypothetical protein
VIARRRNLAIVYFFFFFPTPVIRIVCGMIPPALVAHSYLVYKYIYRVWNEGATRHELADRERKCR